MQLLGADIYCIDLFSSMLERAVGEPTRRGSGIEQAQPSKLEAKSAYGFFQLEAAAAHIPKGITQHLYVVAGFYPLRCLVGHHPIHAHQPLFDGQAGPLPGRENAAFDEPLVEPHDKMVVGQW